MFDVYRQKLKNRKNKHTGESQHNNSIQQHHRQTESDQKVPARFYSPVYESVDELKTALKDGVVDHDIKLKAHGIRYFIMLIILEFLSFIA